MGPTSQKLTLHCKKRMAIMKHLIQVSLTTHLPSGMSNWEGTVIEKKLHLRENYFLVNCATKQINLLVLLS